MSDPSWPEAIEAELRETGDELARTREQLARVTERAEEYRAEREEQRDWVEQCKAERDAALARVSELEGALKDAATNMEQSHKNYCGPYEPYGRHAPECWLDDAKELRAALARKEGAGD